MLDRAPSRRAPFAHFAPRLPPVAVARSSAMPRERRAATQANAAMYVGYADDDESPASIMAKFAALEEAKDGKKHAGNSGEDVELSEEELVKAVGLRVGCGVDYSMVEAPPGGDRGPRGAQGAKGEHVAPEELDAVDADDARARLVAGAGFVPAEQRAEEEQERGGTAAEPTSRVPIEVGRDVALVDLFGVDAETRERIVRDALPESVDLEERERFADELLGAMRAAAFRRSNDPKAPPATLEAAIASLREASSHSADGASPSASQCAKAMDRAFRRAKPGSFEARPKGVGLIALRPFAEGEYLGEYCGELYPPWRWFEKEASASAVRKAVRRDDEVPTFYDAVVERRREDPRGYDAMFVDGHVKGSVLTRASHSCEPNAAMRVRVREGSYALEMIAVKPVAIGDEICWDYKCSTDSRDEMRRATCCCGARGCRVSYLYYTADDRVNAHAAKHGTAARFTAALLRACGPVADGRDEAEERRRLERFLARGALGFKSEADRGALAGAPEWLARFAAYCASFVEEETEALERSLLKEALAEREEALRAKSEERGEEAKPPGGSNGSPPGPVPGPSDAELAKMRAEVKAEAANVTGGRAQ